jgi:sec-independent protein translocase protein TatB
MFDLEWSKLLVIGVVALLVIKPKDLPKALRTLGQWVRHARQVAAEFQTSVEQMAREAELADVKKDIEDATRQVTADIEKSLDPVEVEKLLAEGTQPTSASTTPSIEPPPAAQVEAAVAASSGAPPEQAAPAPPPDEPTLPFPEPLPSTPPADKPTLEPAGAKPGPTDRV